MKEALLFLRGNAIRSMIEIVSIRTLMKRGILHPVVEMFRQSAGIIVRNRTALARNNFLMRPSTMAGQEASGLVQKGWKNGLSRGACHKLLRKRKFFAQL